jgi:predicted GTPase
MNKSEALDEHGVLTSAAGEAHRLGFGDPVAISAETGLGMAELYEILRPLFEEYMFQLPNSKFVALCSMILVSVLIHGNLILVPLSRMIFALFQYCGW